MYQVEAVESSETNAKVCGNVFDQPQLILVNLLSLVPNQARSGTVGRALRCLCLNYAEVRGYSKERMLEALDIHRDGPNKRKVASTRNRVGNDPTPVWLQPFARGLR